jgi:tetratricopeptide (TPR) repeat protein
MRPRHPDLPPGWRSAIAAEALAPIDAGAARLRWLDALALSPEDPEILSGYATFLTDQGREPGDAEHLYRLAVRLKPTDGAHAANLARLLLAQGRSAEGLEQLAAALALGLSEPAPRSDLLAELMFYMVAHDRGRSAAALATLKRLIASGARCPGWNFEPTLFRAQDDHHPELALLRDIAKVLAHGADPAELGAHVAWAQG